MKPIGGDLITEPPIGLSAFTDGTRYSHVLIQELYIDEEIWNLVSGTGQLKLYQAIIETHPNGPLITIVDLSSFNASTWEYENYFYTDDIFSSVVTLNGVGAFYGKKCFMVIQWQQAWTKCSQYNLITNGVITFNSLINNQNTKDISFSPTIGMYLESLTDTPNLGFVSLPEETFVRESFTLDNSSFQVFNVANYSELVNIISHYDQVIINLTADIKVPPHNEVGTIVGLTIPDGKTIIVNGNNHKIFEFHDNQNYYNFPNVFNGRRYGAYSGAVQPNMAFSTEDGTMLLLEKSKVFRADRWSSGTTFVVNENDTFNRNIDNVFIHYGAWYQRRVNPVVNFSDQTLAFSRGSLSKDDYDFYENAIKNTSRPYFYFSNYDNTTFQSGVLIKENKLYYPSIYHGISECTIEQLILVLGTLVLNNTIVSGGKDCAIYNWGTLKMSGCQITNKIGSGVRSAKKLFVENCIFTDILGHGIIAMYERILASANYHPYLDVTNCHFINIAIYGSCTSGVFSTVKGYIANNEFVDNNYNCIYIGTNHLKYGDDPSSYNNLDQNTYQSLRLNACSNLVEYNTIRYTPTWKELRKSLGLQDGGAIYISTNNFKAIVRYNKVLCVGGPSHAENIRYRGIFCDDGAYNFSVYCNIITHTEVNNDDHYDIDSRDCYADRSSFFIPITEEINTNNYIGYNLCDGCLRMQEFKSTYDGKMPINNCIFEKNIIIRHFSCQEAHKYVNTINSKFHPYLACTPIVYDHSGSISEDGSIISSLNYQQMLGYDHIGCTL